MSSHRRLWGIASAAIAALAVVAVVGPAEAQQLDSVVVVDEGAGTVVYKLPDFGPVVIADGLVNPRGLAMSPDGTILVVVESGDAAGQGRLIGVQPNLEVSVLVDGLDFPEGVAFIDDTTLIVSTVADKTLSEYVLGDSRVQPIMPLQSAPTGLAVIPVGPDGGFPPVAVSTWNGLGLIFENGNITPFTDLLDGGGHPAFSPDLGVCIPEFDQDWVSCWPFGGGQPQLVQGFDKPVGVAILPSGLLAVSDSTGVHAVDPRDGTVLYTLPFENPAAMVVPGDRDGLWKPALQPEQPTTTTEAPTSTAPTTTASPTTAATAPATTIGAAAGSTTPAGSGDEGSSSGLWWFLGGFALIFALVAVAASRLGTTGEAPASSEPLPTPVKAASDPCDDLCDEARKAEAEAERAEAEADAAEKAATDAERRAADGSSKAEQANNDASRAKHDAERADRDAEQARKPTGHSGGRAASGDREYTGADNDRVNAESARIDAAVAAGHMTQQEAQAEKATLRDPAKWKELRDKEEADGRQRVAEAERKADDARRARQQAEDEAHRARSEADASRKEADAKRETAEAARRHAEDARADAKAKRAACEECRRDAAIEAAGGADSWKVAQGHVGGPCSDGDAPETITRTETFLVADESRSVEVSDESIRPARISAEDRGVIRGVFSKVGHLLGFVSMSPAVPLVFKIPMKYLSFMSKGATSILDDLDSALEKAKRPGGLSDYYFVKVSIPRTKVTVTCTCTIECHNWVRTCVGCVAKESSEPGDLVKTSEGSRVEVEKFIAGMQAQAAAAGKQEALRKAFRDTCNCS